MIIFRVTAILLPQVLGLLVVGARLDLLFGFNRTDTGFSTLLLLLAAVPVISLVWLIAEIIISARHAQQQKRALSFLFPTMAFIILLESLVIDIVMLSQARM